MIIEMRTYTLKPGSIAEAEKRFGDGAAGAREALETRRVLAHRSRPAEPDHPCLGL